MSRAPAAPRALVACAAALALLAGCTAERDTRPGPEPDPAPGPGPVREALAPVDPASSLTAAGQRLYARSRAQERPRPRYEVSATVDPEDGTVAGTLHALLPRVAGPLTFRFFPGLPVLETGARVADVTVDGAPVEAELEASLLTVPLPEASTARTVEVVVPFGYTVPARAGGPAGAFGDLTPADIGLLGRSETEVSLAHWMPLWIPPGRSAEPKPDGFGDLGNFAAADIRMHLAVPQGWTVVDGGVQTGVVTEDGSTVVTSEGSGMRDLAVSVLSGHETRSRRLDGALRGVRITATAPAAQADDLPAVLDETEDAIRVLSATYGPYPWREFDVVSVPLGAAVGGMEWPGATWIQGGLFGGGVPGLGDLVSGEQAGELLERFGGEDGRDLALLVSSTRRWTVTHEVAHSWWTVLVGNDSLLDPVVDEPLAQYGSCVVVREVLADGAEVCRVQVETGYTAMRDAGVPDDAADQASDAFVSGTQYGGLVYGKAAAFYLALEDAYGTAALNRALRALVRTGAFRTVTPEQVEDVLAKALGEDVRPRWDRWMRQAHGDQDVG